MEKKKGVSKNIIMLYLMNATQLLLPLITLPYLSRILSVEGYGIVTYTKSVNAYIVLLIEFGFILSGTREIAEKNDNIYEIKKILSAITIGKLILSVFALAILSIMVYFIPILRSNITFALLSFVSPFLSIFLFDYVFRGLELMQIVTYRYLVMKGFSTALTFICIKSENDLLLIPILDIFGSIAAIVLVFLEMKKLNLGFVHVKFKDVVDRLETSAIYFLSSIATTAFGALNTLLVGIYLNSKQVAYWGLLMTLVGAIQTMYSPISDGIYPRMVVTKSLRLFVKVITFFIPFLIIGSIFILWQSNFIISIIAGRKYEIVSSYLKLSIPLIDISFFSILVGWPLLGAIGKVKQVTESTVGTAIFQIVGLVMLIVLEKFSITNLILLRTITELFMALFRIYIVAINKREFTD